MDPPPQLLTQAQLISVHTDVPVGIGKCLDAYPRNDGANVHQWSCQQGNTWRLNPISENTYQIVHLISGKCLDVAGASTQDGANVQLGPATAATPTSSGGSAGPCMGDPHPWRSSADQRVATKAMTRQGVSHSSMPEPRLRTVLADLSWADHMTTTANSGVDITTVRDAYHPAGNDETPICPQCGLAAPAE